MKKNIIIFLSVIVGAILLRYGFSLFSNFMQGKAMMNKRTRYRITSFFTQAPS